MQFHDEPSVAAEYLRKAVPLMVEREIPTSPHNFALWYSHVKGADSGLSNKLLAEFSQPGSYDHEKGEALFYEYFVKEYLPKNDQAQEALVGLLSQLFNTVNKTVEGTSEFGQSIQETMRRVKGEDDPQAIQKALGDLLQNTDAVEELTRNFQSELQTARQEVETLKQQLETTEKSALMDELTGIGNRRAFDQTLEGALVSTVPTCLLLLDLDHFKKCNDTYGHVMGDKILEAMGKVLSRYHGEDAQVARYGGEEFAIVFSGETTGAAQLGETIRRSVEAIRIRQKGSQEAIDNITISIGVAKALPQEDSRSLKERADKALYEAKEQGRNRVIVAEELAGAA